MKITSARVKRAQARKKAYVVERFGGACQTCGYSKCLAALEFHHVDGKEESPSYVIMAWSWERAKKELAKCVLLCSNCHKEVHYGVRELDYTVLRPFVSICCKQCKKTFDTKKVDQQFCSYLCASLSARRVIRPDAQELQILLQNTSFVQVGRMFGVSDNAVRKWAKQYKLLPG